MKNVYLRSAKLRKLFSPLLFLMLLALFPAVTLAVAPTINSIANSQGTIITGTPSFMPGQAFIVNFSSTATGFYYIQLSNPDGTFPTPSTILNYGSNGTKSTGWQQTSAPSNKNFAGCIPISTA